MTIIINASITLLGLVVVVPLALRWAIRPSRSKIGAIPLSVYRPASRYFGDRSQRNSFYCRIAAWLSSCILFWALLYLAISAVTQKLIIDRYSSVFDVVPTHVVQLSVGLFCLWVWRFVIQSGIGKVARTIRKADRDEFGSVASVLNELRKLLKDPNLPGILSKAVQILYLSGRLLSVVNIPSVFMSPLYKSFFLDRGAALDGAARLLADHCGEERMFSICRGRVEEQVDPANTRFTVPERAKGLAQELMKRHPIPNRYIDAKEELSDWIRAETEGISGRNIDRKRPNAAIKMSFFCGRLRGKATIVDYSLSCRGLGITTRKRLRKRDAIKCKIKGHRFAATITHANSTVDERTNDVIPMYGLEISPAERLPLIQLLRKYQL